MQAALLPDRGVVKVAGDDARKFLNGLVTSDVSQVTPERPSFGALLTPQGKIIADFIMAEAPATTGGGFFLDCPRALAPALVQRLNLPPLLAHEAASKLGAAHAAPAAYEAHRIALGVPRGGLDFIYGDAFPHETDMDQLGGVDFDKGCFVGQEVVSRIEHRGTARTRVVPVAFDGFAPEAGTPVSAGDKAVGTLGSSAQGRGLAMLRLDRAADALAAGAPFVSGGVEMRLVKPTWAQFPWPGESKAAE
jgi:tRNA-modifying protein YgfZ